MSITTTRNLTDLINAVGYYATITPPVPREYNYTAYQFVSNENEYVVEIPLLGIKRENISVDIVTDTLTVTAKADVNAKYGTNFKQSWYLAKDCDSENITAKSENGILTVRIPRTKPPKRTISVEVV